MPEPETRYLVGTSLICISLINIFTNLALVLYSSYWDILKRLLLRCRRVIYRRKQQKINKAIRKAFVENQKKILEQIKAESEMKKQSKVEVNQTSLSKVPIFSQ